MFCAEQVILHCPKINLNYRILTEPDTVGTTCIDIRYLCMFIGHKCVQKSVASASTVTGSVFMQRFGTFLLQRFYYGKDTSISILLSNKGVTVYTVGIKINSILRNKMGLDRAN